MSSKLRLVIGFALSVGIAVAVIAWSKYASNVKEARLLAAAVLPQPPEQTAGWDTTSDPELETLGDASKTLFEQGMADPRGCEYRTITVQVGSVWGRSESRQTHGWLFPDQKFAVCWNGLVYPVEKVGPPTSLAQDVETSALGSVPKNGSNRLELFDKFPPETIAIDYHGTSNLRSCLLLRLGEVTLAKRLAAAALVEENRPYGGSGDTASYLSLARTWAWMLYDRAVCAHQRGDSQMSYWSADLLTRVQPLIERECERRGLPREPYFDTARQNELQPYLNFLEPLPLLLADERRRIVTGRKVDIDALLKEVGPRRIPDLVDALDQVQARQWGQPGGISWEDDKIIAALIAEGDAAVEPLLNALDYDSRLTRSVSFGRDFAADRELLPAKAAAWSALAGIFGTTELKGSEMRAYWKKYKGRPTGEQWYGTLADDKADPKQWLDAADHIVSAPDETFGPSGFRRMHTPKLGEVMPLSGEPLRKKSAPSVSELMARRVPTMAAQDNGWLFAQTNAADMALYLHRWDAAAAIPVLREQMQRCMAASDADRRSIHPEPNWSQSTQTTEQMARDVGRLTTALAESSDAVGTQMYRRWVVTQNPALPGGNVGEMLRPIWRFPNEPNLAEAAEELFNGPNSSWNCLPIAIQFHDWGPTTLISSAIYGVPAFRRYLARNLNDVTQIGTVQVRGHGLDVTVDPGRWGGVNVTDPLLPKSTDVPLSVRVCDWYACKIADLDGAPPYEVYWPVAKRDEQRPKVLAFLERWGDRFRYTPLQDMLDFGFPDRDSGRLTFPQLDHPATDADVTATTAIFSLHGDPVRVVPLAVWPAKAKWVTLKDYPVQLQGQTDMETGVTKYYDDFLNKGYVWQAEEILQNGKWERYYGFVGHHVIAKVAADQIELIKDK